MDFFEQVYWDNSIKAYCFAFGTILIIFLLKKFVSKYIVTLFFKVTKRIWKNTGKKNFINLVVEPLEMFLLILISVFALDKLNFPSILNYSIYGHTINQILNKIGIGAIIFSFIWLLLRIVDFISAILRKREKVTIDRSSNQLIVFFRDFLKVIIGIIGLLLIIKACFNQDIGNLLTGLSIVGAAMALAAKESLENLIASFIIFFDKPFITGDTLQVNTVSGTVEKIGLRSTRIRTAEKTLVTVPNKQMVDSVVDNLSMRTNYRFEMKFELAVTTSAQKVKEFINSFKELLQSKTPPITTFTVLLKEINKSGLLIITEYFTQSISIEELNILREEINLSIKEKLEASGLSLAKNTTTNIAPEKNF